MKRFAAILLLPYLAPIAIFCLIDYLWRLATNSAPSVGMFFGGEIPGFYVYLLIGIFLQVVAGIPVGIVLANAKSREVRGCCALALVVTPFLTVGAIPTRLGALTAWEALGLLAEVIFFCLASGAALFCIYPDNRNKTEQVVDGKPPEAPHPPH